MPEVYLKVKWPDEVIQEIYSPSTIIHTFFTSGEKMTVNEFTEKSKTALNKASNRVAERYGYACSSAMASLDSVLNKAHQLEDDTGTVEILELT